MVPYKDCVSSYETNIVENVIILLTRKYRYYATNSKKLYYVQSKSSKSII